MKKNSIKFKWHKQMRERALTYSSQKCQICNKTTEVTTGVIHHLIYPAGVYEREVEDLIDEGICVWLCKKCHNEIHISKTLEESKTHLKGGGYCHYCGKLVYGGWDRAKSIGVDYCLCRNCYRKIKPRKTKEDAGQISFFQIDGKE